MKYSGINLQKKFVLPVILSMLPGIVGRILIMPTHSFITSNENLESSIGMFLMGTSMLLFLMVAVWFSRPFEKMKFRWYFFLFLITLPFTILWIGLWIKAFIAFMKAFQP